jgi:hypothetical protein
VFFNGMFSIVIKSFRAPNKNIIINSFITLLFIFSICRFVYLLKDIQRSDSVTVYAADFIAYYSAAKLINNGESSKIYADKQSGFFADSGRFFEIACNSGFMWSPTRFLYMPIFASPFLLLADYPFETAANIWLVLNLIIMGMVIVVQLRLTDGFSCIRIRLMSVVLLNLLSFPAAYFLYRRRFKLVFACLGTIAIIVSISIFYYGFPLHKTYFECFFMLVDKTPATWSNQSLDAFLLRLICDVDVLDFRAAISAKKILTIKYAIAVMLATVIWLLFKRQKHVNFRRLFPLEFSLLVLVYLLMPNISWQHYFACCSIPVVLVMSVCDIKKYTVSNYAVLFGMIAGYIMTALPPFYVEKIQQMDHPYFYCKLISLPFYGACVMLFTILFLLYREAVTKQEHLLS